MYIINIYEKINCNIYYIGCLEYKKDSPLPRKDDFINIMINEKPSLYRINAVLFDYIDNNELISFLVDKAKE